MGVLSMKTLSIIFITAWVSILTHNYILESDGNYYHFKKDSINAVCTIHKFYQDLIDDER